MRSGAVRESVLLLLLAHTVALLQGSGKTTAPTTPPQATPECQGSNCKVEPEPATPPPSGTYMAPTGPKGVAQCFVDTTWWWNEVVMLPDVQFGRAINPYTHQTQSLKLDVYQPASNDHRSKRPAVVLIHGGAFISGDKTNDYMPDLAKNFAIRGYVAFSINYRMAENFLEMLPGLMDGKNLKPINIAQEDAKAAVRYVRANAAQYRIDPDRIMIGGHSAGAITALYYAYWPGAPEGSSGTPGVSSSIQGLFSVSGEMKMQAFCDSIDPGTLKPEGCKLNTPIDFTNDMTQGQEPLLAVHGTMDKVVPYINGEETNTRAGNVGLDHHLITIQNADHMGAMVQLLDSNELFITDFMKQASQQLRLLGAECPPRVHSEAENAAHSEAERAAAKETLV